jgi:exonuclease III
MWMFYACQNMEEYVKLISIDKFKMASNSSRSRSDHGVSCIYVKHHVQPKEINYLKGISKEKDFEMTAVEMLDYKLIIVCVYRSPDGDFSTFLRSLESAIQKVQARNKRLIRCGDWNIKFIQESVKLHDMQTLLLFHNLVNTVRPQLELQKVQYH